jgi:hypothetical protein
MATFDLDVPPRKGRSVDLDHARPRRARRRAIPSAVQPGDEGSAPAQRMQEDDAHRRGGQDQGEGQDRLDRPFARALVAGEGEGGGDTRGQDDEGRKRPPPRA